SVAFSPDSRRVASASDDHTARVWDAATGAELRALTGHAGPVHSVAFSPDGRRLATASYDHTARVWDAATGAELLSLRGHTSPVWSVAFSPDGRRLATASHEKTARVWDGTVLTPEQRRDRYVVGVVCSLWEELLFHDELLARIRADKFLDEA